MRLLNSEITGKDRKQMSCVMKLCLPSLTYRTELSSQLTLNLFRKQPTLQRWMLLLYGFWSLESSWQYDIKAASRLLLAANYIKRPRKLGFWIRYPLPPFPYLATPFKRVSEFMMRGSTRCRRQSQPQKHQGRVWPQKQRVKGQGLTETDACSWMGDANDSDSLVFRYRKKNSMLQLSYTDRYICSLMSVIVLFFFKDWPSSAQFFFFTLILFYYVVFFTILIRGSVAKPARFVPDRNISTYHDIWCGCKWCQEIAC